jgi:hypothetical protein
MNRIIKAGNIDQEGLDVLIFYVKSVEILKIFITAGADINKSGPRGHPIPEYLLWRITDRQDTLFKDNVTRRKIITHLVNAGAVVNCCNCDGITPLLNCAKNGDLTMVKWLVENGGDAKISTFVCR